MPRAVALLQKELAVGPAGAGEFRLMLDRVS